MPYGPKYPGTYVTAAVSPNDDVDWDDKTGLGADDTDYVVITSASFDTNAFSYVFQCTNFGFTVNTAATIRGIVVEMDRRTDAKTARDSLVQLRVAAGPTGDNKKSATEWPTAGFGVTTYGSASDTWNVALTPAIVNASTFGVDFAVEALGANTDVSVDYIRISVYADQPSSVSGALTSSGAITRKVALPRTGALTSSGSPVRRVWRSLTGALTSVGTAAKGIFGVFTSALTSIGDIVSEWIEGVPPGPVTYYLLLTLTTGTAGGGTETPSTVGGALTSIGLLAQATARSVSGSITNAGVLAKRTVRSLTSAFTNAGTLTRKTARVATGALTSVGVVTRKSVRAFAGVITTAGAPSLRTFRSLLGSLTNAGTTSKAPTRIFTAVLTTGGAIALRTARTISGAFASSGGLVRAIGRVLTGALTSSGLASAAGKIAQILTGDLTPIGDLAKRATSTLTGTLSSAGVAAKQMPRMFSGALTSGGALTRWIGVVLQGSLATVGSASKQVTRAITGTLTSLGGVIGSTAAQVWHYLMLTLTTQSAVTPTPTALRHYLMLALTTEGGEPTGSRNYLLLALSTLSTLTKDLVGILTSGGDVEILTSRSLSGVLTSLGTFTSNYWRDLVGVLTSAGQIAKRTAREFIPSAVLSTGGIVQLLTLIGAWGRSLGGTFTPTGALGHVVLVPLTAGLTTAGAIVKRTTRSFAAGLTTAGIFLKRIQKVFVGEFGQLEGWIFGQLLAGKEIPYYPYLMLALSTRGQEPGYHHMLSLVFSSGLQVNKQFAALVSGDASSVGTSVTRRVRFALAGALNSAGAAAKQTARQLTGTPQPTGIVTRAALTFIGVFAGVLSAIGNLLIVIAGHVGIRDEVVTATAVDTGPSTRISSADSTVTPGTIARVGDSLATRISSSDEVVTQVDIDNA